MYLKYLNLALGGEQGCVYISRHPGHGTIRNLRCVDKHSPAPDRNLRPRTWEAVMLARRLKPMGASICRGVRFIHCTALYLLATVTLTPPLNITPNLSHGTSVA